MGGGGGSPPSSPPPSSPPPSSPGGNGGGNNKPKCEKCRVNDAEHTGMNLKIGEEKITLYNGYICDPCAKELLKCQICKNEEIEHIIKKEDGLKDILLCEKCFRCSKCNVNQLFTRKVEDEGKILYKGSICETCIRELIKCEECKTNSAVKPDMSIRKNQQNINTCEACLQKTKKLGKCKDCQQEIDPDSLPMMMPEWAFEKPDEEKQVKGHKIGGKPIYCWPCVEKRLKEEKQGNTNTNKTNRPANPSLCKGCNKELPWERGFTKHIFLKTRDNYGNTERHGGFCRPCAEEFKRNHQQTCSQCSKREWPEIKKGWALDFENQALFCSYTCRCDWLEKHSNNKFCKCCGKEVDKLVEVEEDLYTGMDEPVKIKKKVCKDCIGEHEHLIEAPQYESHVSGGISGAVYLPLDEVELDSDSKKDFDLEKEADKKEIFDLKEFNKKLKDKVDKSKSDPELSDREKKMAEYFLNLVENSKKKAEQDYGNKYGKSELEDLLTGSNQEQQPKKNHWPLIIGGGLVGIGVITGLIYYFWSKKVSKQNL